MTQNSDPTYRFQDASNYYLDRPRRDDWKDAFDNTEKTVPAYAEPAYVDVDPLDFGTSPIDKNYEVLLRIARALERLAENTDSVADYYDLRYKNDKNKVSIQGVSYSEEMPN